MKRDAALLHVPLPEDSERVRLQLLKLLDANHAPDASLRVVVVRNSGGMWQGPSTGRASDLIALSADLKDWGSGVKLTYAPQARHSQCAFAGTKVLAWSFNLAWLEDAQVQGFDEVILLNERGEVSECTSANPLYGERESGVHSSALIRMPSRSHPPPIAVRCSFAGLPSRRAGDQTRRSGERGRGIHYVDHPRPPAGVRNDGKKIRNSGKACARSSRHSAITCPVTSPTTDLSQSGSRLGGIACLSQRHWEVGVRTGGRVGASLEARTEAGAKRKMVPSDPR